MNGRLELLTPREREVLALLQRGLTNGDISRELGISFPTAKAHVSSILAKAGVASRKEAVSWFADNESSATRPPWQRWVFAPLAAAVLGTAAVAGFTAYSELRDDTVRHRPNSVAVPLDALQAGIPLRVDVDGLGKSTYDRSLFLWVLLTVDGRVNSYLAWDPSSGCSVEWRGRFAISEEEFGEVEEGEPVQPWVGAFRDPCSGSTYDRDGVAHFGPTPRGLDGFQAQIQGEDVVIDLRQVRSGWCRTRTTPCSEPTGLVFRSDVGDPSISGWGTRNMPCSSPVTDGGNHPPGWCTPRQPPLGAAPTASPP